VFVKAINISEWLRCPECGSEEVSAPLPPNQGRNAYFECPECGQTGVIAG